MKATKNPITLVGAVALAGGMMALGGAMAPPAHAGVVGINIGTGSAFGGSYFANGSNVGGGIAGMSGTFGNFFVSADGLDTSTLGLPQLLDSNAITASSQGGSGTLWVWVNSTDLFQPATSGNLSVQSSFTENNITGPGTMTVTEYAWFNENNQYQGTGWVGSGTSSGGSYFTTETAVGSAFFTGIGGTDFSPWTLVGVNGPFSVTQLFEFQASGQISANATIDTYVPEPSSLGILGLGLSAIGGLGWFSRRRKQKSLK